ncbi:efflux RND transporter periplasmic adaptor subunit [Aquabacterium sp. J223]|uniref:efflux RND transporter periplasmic adaptor subunit n=1 Tax=Aquabacterium sp. J223 TaxID=2898431 RepID=UPI0021AE2DAA|nr:efflux RND transporter periplasmic adaptor subunit [Aquabacterium sp. J223]UUX97083.1 efflux RND transporter periplasmic adaptor subunit [Aquabacterium sp. J223]
MPHRLSSTAATLAIAVLLAGCDDKPAQGPGGPGAPGGGMPPVQVGVVTVGAPTSLPVFTELPGRVEALRTAQVRARVTGIVQQRLFREGSDVKAGQPLFRIDPAPYQAALQSAQATLARAEAAQASAAAQFNRLKPLREANAVSQQEFTNAEAALLQAQADVAAGRAGVVTAQLNLGYANVTAPISGRIGRALVTEGALVTQAEATQMALIQQVDPVYVNFTQSATELQRLRRLPGANTAAGLPVRIVLEDGSELPRGGRLLFSDLSVDTTSGQVTLRAEVPNADRALLPGQYVRGRLAQQQIDNAVLLPQQAVTRGQQGDTVLAIGPDGKPAPRPVTLGPAQGNQWVVLGGLKPGDQVVVDGVQKLQMMRGAPVQAVPWTPAQAASAPGRPASVAAASAPAAASAASR